ncbi:MAG TPA: FAD:protein FMN transferase [Candidatus Aminicenantes bacterium]|nr:FAD:protein FMN transferase [Candidatus Aminicenantes bacterium]
MKKYGVLILVVVFAFNCGPQKTWHSSTLVFFDTVCELRVFGSSPEFSQVKKEVEKIFSSIEELFSPEKTDLKSSHVQYLLRESLKIYKNTDGCFDITVGPLKEAWGFLSGHYRVPSSEEINGLIKLVGMDKIQIKNDEVILPEQMKLDWGGIAKGYGVDLASQALRKMNIQKGFLNAGGDIFCWGQNPENNDWKIGIKHPRKEGFLGILHLMDQGAATSGDYQRFFIKNGVRYHHIFDPSTGYPAKGKQSVTVMGPEVLFCDALSTALFVSKEPENILKKYPDYGAVIVNDDGEIFFFGKEFDIELIK